MATAPGQLPGMSGPADLQAAGDYDQMAAEQGPAPISVTISLTPEGIISVTSEGAEPMEAANLDEALQVAGQMFAQLSQQSGAAPDQMEAQALWDQMAAQRSPRGNTM